MDQLPSIIQKINKDAKSTKITTLDKAVSFKLKRMFSGSISGDILTGGGYAFRRIHLLFGNKSTGKNSTLYQTIAYNQRLCRACGGLLTKFWNSSGDRHAIFLQHVLKIRKCTCNGKGRVFLILDYEKSIEQVDPKIVTINEYKRQKDGAEITEEDYKEAVELLNKFKSKETLTDEEKEEVKNLEKYLDGVAVVTHQVEQIGTSDYLQSCGVLTTELLVADPEDTEEGIEHAREVIKSKEVDGILWDSIQAAIPKWVKGRDSDSDTMGKEAKQNALLMRHICSAFSAKDLLDETEAYKPAVFLTSQMRSSMSQYVADSYSGGHGIRHHISLALELKREKFLKNDGTEATFKDQYYGQEIRLRAEKNKLAPPGDLYTINYYFRNSEKFKIGEIDHVQEIVNLGISYNLIDRAGAYYKVRGETFQGIQKLTEFFRANPDFVGDLYEDIKEKTNLL